MYRRGGLSVVRDFPQHDDGRFDVFLVRAGGSAVFQAIERDDIAVPLIGFKCANYWQPLNAMMWAGPDYGMQLGAVVTAIWKGRRINITGPAVLIESDLGLILPRGTLP